MKKIFIMNLGTTSFKFKLYHFSAEQQQVLASGEIESVGAEQSAYELQLGDAKKEKGMIPIPDHGTGFSFMRFAERNWIEACRTCRRLLCRATF